MGIYRRHGVHEFVLCLGHKGEMIRQCFEGSDGVTLVDTGEEATTGGRIRAIEPYVRGETFHLTYGDGLGNVNITSLTDFHNACKPTITLTAVQPPSKFGELTMNDVTNRIETFNEKPSSSRMINGGFMVCSPKVFDYLPKDEPLERVPMEAIVGNREAVAYRHHGFWHAMDTYADYLELNALWQKGNAPWTV
jgi:glucose-1-phosphate cytidylyltransferase